MNIQLNNVEIDEAIANYMESLGFDTTDKTVKIELTAGRKNGYSAAVSIEAKTATVTEVKPVEAIPATTETEDKSADEPLFG